MATDPRPRRNNLGFAIVLIALGVVLLVMIRRPDFDPWRALDLYWPFILIFIGLGKLLDHLMNRNSPQGGRSSVISGSAIALLVLVGLFAIFARGAHPFRFSDHIVGSGSANHVAQELKKQGAESVVAKINIPAGELTIDGGSDQLLNADFTFSDDMDQPNVSYNVSGTSGRLDITQHERGGIHIGNTHDEWTLKFGDLPMELEIQMGAGQGDLNLQQVDLSRLRIEMGAGEINVNLTGDRKRNLMADIQGGVGSATIRLPKEVGVQVRAEGGIGSVDTEGLRKEGGYYVNDAYGKSPITIRMNIEGGVGEIRLIQEQ
ncbi:MAG: toast rack family protein [Candidatus Acidiferrales bacterium]